MDMENHLIFFRDGGEEAVSLAVTWLKGSPKRVLSEALGVHEKFGHISFIHLEPLMREEGSFEDWRDFPSTSFFVESFSKLANWQKKQITDFIASYEKDISSKLIMGD